MAPTYVPSSDGVRIAVHDLGGPAQPHAPVILFSHATGFHARVWAPMAAHLVDEFHCLAIDYRGHGVTHSPEGLDFDWRGFGDDTTAVLDSGIIPEGIAVHGAGHSMGGTALVMAAERRPGTLASLWLFEPIVAPPGARLYGDGPSPMSTARRRRQTFSSFEAAIENFASKPPLDRLHPDALWEYVEGGFAEEIGSVTLRCRPEWEAAIFESARRSTAWDHLAALDLPVTVVTGEEVPFGPAAFAPALAQALPHGRLSEHHELGHFGPLEEPGKMAVELAAWIGDVEGGTVRQLG